MEVKKKKHTVRKVLLSILLFIVTFLLVVNVIPPKKVIDNNPFIIKEGSRPLIAAHRGGKNLNPENTFKAMNHSITNYDIDILEMDLCMTSDGYLILNHNEDINESTDVTTPNYLVREHTLNELQQFNFGYNFKDPVSGEFIYRNLLDNVAPENKSQVLLENELRVVTIDELFNAYATSDLMYIIEIKDSGDLGLRATDTLVSKIIEYKLEKKVVVGTFHDEVEQHLSKKYPDIMRGASVGAAAKFVITQLLKVNLFDNSSFIALQIPTSYKFKGITVPLTWKTYVNRAHRRNISVQYWTINDKKEMKKLINLGADVIMTDCPDVMYELLIEMGF